MSHVPLPVMPDSSDRDIALSKAKRVQGWYIDRSQVPDDAVSQAMPTWIEFIRRNPDTTLPGGVAGALLAHFERSCAHCHQPMDRLFTCVTAGCAACGTTVDARHG